MKYEDLVWTPVEGKDYKQTVINLNDREIKIVKLDEDSFQIYLDSEEIPKEMSLEFLETQLTEEFKVVKNEGELAPSTPTNTGIINNQDPESYWKELFDDHFETIKNLSWNEPNHEFKYPYLIWKNTVINGVIQVMKMDEDSYLIRGVRHEETENVNWNEEGVKNFYMNYAISHGLPMLLFRDYLSHFHNIK